MAKDQSTMRTRTTGAGWLGTCVYFQMCGTKPEPETASFLA